MPALSLRTLACCALLAPLALTGCDSDDPGDAGPGEEELITRVTLTLTPSAGGSPVTVSVTDAAGLGEDGTFNVPLNLAAGTTYQGAIQLFDDSDPDDVEDLTAEVEEEDTAHKFQYTVAGVDAAVSDLNTDANGLPLGTTFEVSAGAAGTGTLRVQLFHFDEGAVKTADNASDETDVDFTIPLVVQ